MLRHGSRFPSHKQAKRSIEFLNNLRSYTTNHTYNNEFLTKIDEKTFENKPHYGLTQLGAFEMKKIAERFRARYIDLIKSSNLSDISYISSSKPRSIESGTNFTFELFNDVNIKIESKSSEQDFLNLLQINDEMLRGFDMCKVYVKKIKENLGSYDEYNLFKQSKLVRDLVDNFKKRHFIDHNFNVDIGEHKDLMV